MTELIENTKLDRADHLIKTKSIRDIVADLHKAELWLIIAAVAAFLASAFFVVKYFVGGDMTPTTWTIEQWLNALLGLGITAVITAAQAFLYAGGYKGHAAIFATIIVVFFGVFSEVAQSMEREDATVRHRSENSPVFKAALNNIQAVSTNLSQVSSEQQVLAEAKANLQYWQNLQQNKKSAAKYAEVVIERNIATYQHQVSLLTQQVGMENQNRNVVLTGAIQQAKALEYDEDKHYAMIRLLKLGLGISGIWASFLFSMIIIGTFEYAFHFVGTYVADHKKALWLVRRDSQGNAIQSAQSQQQSEQIEQTLTPSLPPTKNTQNTHVPHETLPAYSLQKEDLSTFDREHHANKEIAAVLDSALAAGNVADISQERLIKHIYGTVKTHIQDRSITPTVRPVTDLVTEALREQADVLGIHPAHIGKPQRQKIAEGILVKLEKDGIIHLNEEGGNGKAKYVLAGQVPTTDLEHTVGFKHFGA